MWPFKRTAYAPQLADEIRDLAASQMARLEADAKSGRITQGQLHACWFPTVGAHVLANEFLVGERAALRELRKKDLATENPASQAYVTNQVTMLHVLKTVMERDEEVAGNIDCSHGEVLTIQVEVAGLQVGNVEEVMFALDTDAFKAGGEHLVAWGKRLDIFRMLLTGRRAAPSESEADIQVLEDVVARMTSRLRGRLDAQDT